MLRDVEVGPRAAPVFGAQAVRAELSLEGLMRGEWRASALTLTGPEIGLALDRNGLVATRLRTLGFDVERIAIDRLVVEDGRIALEDAAQRQPRHARQARIRWRSACADRPGQGRGRVRRQWPTVPLSHCDRPPR